MMQEHANQLIMEIAKENGVLIGKNDPIMITHTLNARFFKELEGLKDDALNDFSSLCQQQINEISNTVDSSTKRLSNAIITSAKNEAIAIIKQSSMNVSSELSKCFDNAIGEISSLAERAKHATTISTFTLLFNLLITSVLLYKFFH